MDIDWRRGSLVLELWVGGRCGRKRRWGGVRSWSGCLLKDGLMGGVGKDRK